MIRNWDTAPKIADGAFEFDPPTDAMEIDFIHVDGSTSPR